MEKENSELNKEIREWFYLLQSGYERYIDREYCNYEFIETANSNILRYMRRSQEKIYGIMTLGDFFANYRTKALKLDPTIYPNQFGGVVLLKK